MYRAAKHFLNFSFDAAKKGNASFFNFYGVLIHYPSYLDVYLLILGLLLFGGLLFLGFKDGEISIKSLGTTFISLLGILILAVALNFGLSYLAKTLYPQYSTFYSYHYYNHKWYLLAGIGLTILVCSLLLKKLLQRQSQKSPGLATLLILSILSIIIYRLAPTGTYIMNLPLIALAAGMIIQHFLKNSSNDTLHRAVSFVPIVFTIGLWTFIVHTLFLAFSLNAIAAAIIPVVLFSFIAASLFPKMYDDQLLLWSGVGIFIVSLVVAHLLSQPTEAKPLKSNLYYLHDGATGENFIATKDRFINDGHLGHFSDEHQNRFEIHLPYSRYHKNTTIDLSSFISNKVEVKGGILLQHPKRPFMTHLFLEDVTHVDSILVNGQLNKAFKNGANGQYYSPMFGIGLDSLQVKVVKRDSSVTVPIYINMEYNEMPSEENLPKTIIRNDGSTYISEYFKI